MDDDEQADQEAEALVRALEAEMDADYLMTMAQVDSLWDREDYEIWREIRRPLSNRHC